MILIARAFDASRLTLSVDSSVRTRIFLRTHNENTRADARVFRDGASSALSVSAEWLLG
jgi:hypothetical protein